MRWLLVFALVALVSCAKFNGAGTIKVDDAEPVAVTVNVLDDIIKYDYGTPNFVELEDFSKPKGSFRLQECVSGDATCNSFTISGSVPDFNLGKGRNSGGSTTQIGTPSVSVRCFTSGDTELCWDRDNSNQLRRWTEKRGESTRQVFFDTYQSGTANVDTDGSLSQCQVVCTTKIDLVLVLDASGSISADDWEVEKQFALDLIGSFSEIGDDAVRIGLVTFATDVELQIPLNSGNNLASITNTINDMDQQQGQTNIGEAIEEGHSLFSNPRPGVPQIMFLLTDGQANEPKDGPKALAVRQANLAKADGIDLYVVGVGDQVDRDDLSSLASTPSEDYTYFTANFDDLDSSVFVNDVCVASGDQSSCVDECNDKELCVCGICECALTTCRYDGEVTDNCGCDCSAIANVKDDCSGCDVECVKGTINSDCSCSCPSPWGGDGCDDCTLESCGKNQHLDDGDCACECDKAWRYGNYNGEEGCVQCASGYCKHGSSASPPNCEECNCLAYWSGDQCDHCDLPEKCQNGGSRDTGSQSSCRLRSELRTDLWDWLNLAVSLPFVLSIVARV